MIKIFSILVSIIILWFTTSQLYVIAKGTIVQDLTFYSIIIQFFTGLALLLTGNFWMLLIGVLFWVLLLLSVLPFTNPYFVHYITRGWHPSATVSKIYYFIITSICLSTFLKTVARIYNWNLILTILLGNIVFIIFLIFIFKMSLKNITAQQWEKYKDDLKNQFKIHK